MSAYQLVLASSSTHYLEYSGHTEINKHKIFLLNTGCTWCGGTETIISDGENYGNANTWDTYCSLSQERYNAQIFTVSNNIILRSVSILGWDKVGSPSLTLKGIILDTTTYGGRSGCTTVTPALYPYLNKYYSTNTIKFEGTPPETPQWYSFCFNCNLGAGSWAFTTYYPNLNDETNDSSNYLKFCTGSGYGDGHLAYKVSAETTNPYGTPLVNYDLSCKICYENITEPLIYGSLYNWYAVDDNRNIAPIGWHVSTNEEWNNLGVALGGTLDTNDPTKERVKFCTTYMKSVGTIQAGTGLWQESAGNEGTNSSGFNILPSGVVTDQGVKGSRSYFANFWCSDEQSSSIGKYKNIGYNSTQIYSDLSVYDKKYGFNVRCVKDDPSGWNEGDVVADYEGRTYKTKLMPDGNVWMIENLQTNYYRNGDKITYCGTAYNWSQQTTGAITNYDLIV